MSLFNAYVALSGAVDADISRDARLAHRTTWRIGGPAAMLAVCHSFAALSRVVEVLGAQDVPWVLMGKGSNILVADEGYGGCVIVLGRDFSRVAVDEGDATITAGAAALLSKVVTQAMRHSLAGLEFACGIPGTLGGAISMDAGSRREWLGRRVSSLVVLRPGTGLVRYAGSDIDWGYRWSSLPGNEIVLEATLALEPGDARGISADMESRLARRRKTQPMGKPSCGSVFRNPPGGEPVAKMLDDLGMKGLRSGGAQVSDVHANFIVNNGSATAADVLALMRNMHDKVSDAYGIDLVPEVNFLGF